MRFTFNIAFIGLAVTSASGGNEMDSVRSPTVWEAPARARNTLSNPTSRRVTTNARTRNLNQNRWSPWGGGWGPSPTKKPTHQPVDANAWGSSWGGNDASNWDWVVNGWNGNAWANDAWTGDGWSSSPKNPTMSPMSAPTTAPPTPEPTSSPTPVVPNSTPNPTPVPTPLPTPEPTSSPTPAVPDPTSNPTAVPTPDPTQEPSLEPSSMPTPDPTQEPSLEPSSMPSSEPSSMLSSEPSSSSMPSPGPSSSLTCVEPPDSLVTNQFFPNSLLVLDNVTEWPPQCGLGNTTDECEAVVCAGLQNAAQEYLCEGLTCCKLDVICNPTAVVQTNNGLTGRFLVTSTVSFPWRISFTVACLTQPCSSDDVAQATEAAAAFAAIRAKVNSLGDLDQKLIFEAIQQDIEAYLALLPETPDTIDATNYFTNTFTFEYDPIESTFDGLPTITPIPANTGPFELVGTSSCFDSVGEGYGYLNYGGISNVEDCALKCVDPACAIQENYTIVGMEWNPVAVQYGSGCDCLIDDIPNDPGNTIYPQDMGDACNELRSGENIDGVGQVAGSYGNPGMSLLCFRKIG